MSPNLDYEGLNTQQVDDVKRDYIVNLEVLSNHTFYIEGCNSPDEAENIAEQLLLDGEEGTLDSREVTSADSFPAEKKDDYN